MTGLIEIHISLADPIVKPAYTVGFLSLVPGPVDVAKADIAKGDRAATDKGEAVEVELCGRFFFAGVGEPPNSE